MKTYAALLLILTTLSAGCASVRSAPPVAVASCPVIPEQEELPPELLEPSFTARMGDFLLGKLPEPISYELRSGPATPTTGLRATQ